MLHDQIFLLLETNPGRNNQSNHQMLSPLHWTVHQEKRTRNKITVKLSLNHIVFPEVKILHLAIPIKKKITDCNSSNENHNLEKVQYSTIGMENDKCGWVVDSEIL